MAKLAQTLHRNAKVGVTKVLTRRLLNNSFLCEVDFTQLYFLDYQRDEIKHHTLSISDRWNPSFARPLILSLRDQQLNCVDGRQTSCAARLSGITKGLAFVWTDWTYQTESKAFFVFNDVPKKQNGWKRFNSALIAGNDTNARILEIIHSGGLTSPYHPHVAHGNLADITECGVIQQVYRAGADPLLKKFVQVMKGWKKGGFVPETAKKTDFGRALKMFLMKHSSPTVIKQLKVVTPDQLRELANTMPSQGRIDATQLRMAMESVTGNLSNLKIAA